MFQGNLKNSQMYPLCTLIYIICDIGVAKIYRSSIPSMKSEKPSPDSHLDDSVVLLKERLGSAYLVTKTRLGQ